MNVARFFSGVCLGALSCVAACGGGNTTTGNAPMDDGGENADGTTGDSGPADSTTPFDSQSADSNAPVDSGAPVDSSAPGDSSAPTDSGSAGDSSAPMDSESPGDSSAPMDSGSPPDSGTDTGPGDASGPPDSGAPVDSGSDAGGHAVQTVFLIMMENHSATSIYGASAASYINTTLIPMGASATAYRTHVHPSEPNYLWLEAGDNFSIADDNDPTSASNQQTTTQHLVTQLTTAGLSWKSWVEGIDGKSCPLTSSKVLSTGTFGAKHVPQLFFSDVTDGFSKTSTTCMAHIRPFSELAMALQNGSAPRYNFIVPDLCDDMHGGQLPCVTGSVATGDNWLKTNVPTILQSSAFQHGGLLLVVWDEGDEPLVGNASDGPLPFIAIGSMVKTNYPSPVSYTHSSTLKTIEEIFGVSLLRGAADPATNDLSDMFSAFP